MSILIQNEDSSLSFIFFISSLLTNHTIPGEFVFVLHQHNTILFLLGLRLPSFVLNALLLHPSSTSLAVQSFTYFTTSYIQPRYTSSRKPATSDRTLLLTMADSSHSSAHTAVHHDLHINTTIQDNEKRITSLDIPAESVKSPLSPTIKFTPLAFKKHATIDFDDYFTGPRDLSKHSKWPLFMQMHGSILPKMILPLLFVGMWSTAITAISIKVHDLGVGKTTLPHEKDSMLSILT